MDLFIFNSYICSITEETRRGNPPRFSSMIAFLRMLRDGAMRRQDARAGRVTVALMTFTGR